VQRRGIQLSKSLKKGSIISSKDIFPLRPCDENSIEPHYMDSLVGRVINQDLEEGQYLKWNHLN